MSKIFKLIKDKLSSDSIIHKKNNQFYNLETYLNNLNFNDLIIYRDITFTKSSIGSKSVAYVETTVPIITGYTCVGVSVTKLSGGNSGYCVVAPATNGDNVVWNGATSSASPTVGLRYLYLKNN